MVSPESGKLDLGRGELATSGGSVLEIVSLGLAPNGRRMRISPIFLFSTSGWWIKA